MRKIKVYSSFEEQKNDEIDAILATSMIDRIATTVNLIKRVYNYKSKEVVLPRKLNFIQNNSL